jgi:hypothetical protein
MGELKSPIAWLQRFAMHEAVKNTVDPQPQSSLPMK